MSPKIRSAESTRFCRLCLTGKGQLHLIFGGGISDLAEKIYDITALELADINGMPSLICDLCRSQVLVSHQFVLQCRVSDWKIQKLVLGSPPVRQDVKVPRLSVDSSSSGIGELTADDSGTSAKVPTKTVAAISPKHDLLRRLKNDDKEARRRHSVDHKSKPKKSSKKRRLSDSSQHDKAMVKVRHDVAEDNRKQKCPTCGVRVIHLNNHIANVHKKAAKLECGICGKTYKNQSIFSCHMNSHNGIRPYKCKLCDKSYSYATSLFDHVKSHQERYHCTVCQAGFTHKRVMWKHMLTH
ncbi:hypothetical protein pipiens_019791 [Culex pipiens pipiens]|uniref:Uncharacterized protein n=1 Tax=Culex pipiens pipiens TaxID=38569 RepID=A0ABD1DRU4_CULPP